ncbi:hypothetical protein HPP92_023282 [Vanilla planifolia]|uniref:Uncharacterized protein n=1 Tax=Vanilla planifolia TaxID=51239 RepID=A0A835PZ45_VANPL|nr:hypothetical protein HPP92_023282 [Vanilla planifolia]
MRLHHLENILVDSFCLFIRFGVVHKEQDVGAQREAELNSMFSGSGGKAHRKKLLSPKGMDVRPMMGVVRGAAFGMLQVLGGCPTCLRPGRWLDLYSGTGSVGIEALSRGCQRCTLLRWILGWYLRS